MKNHDLTRALVNHYLRFFPRVIISSLLRRNWSFRHPSRFPPAKSWSGNSRHIPLLNIEVAHRAGASASGLVLSPKTCLLLADHFNNNLILCSEVFSQSAPLLKKSKICSMRARLHAKAPPIPVVLNQVDSCFRGFLFCPKST